jgi:nucleotide-binding universal stress UspA family protein
VITGPDHPPGSVSRHRLQRCGIRRPRGRDQEKLMDHTKGLIVVGVDGSPEGDAALRFALDEAERTGDAIEVVTAWSHEPIPVAPYAVLGDQRTSDDLQRAAQKRQDAAVARVLGVPPAVAVSARVAQADARILLVEAARRARLLVVGSRPMGPVRAVLLGSVSRYCAHHAACAVVVVPAAAPSADPQPPADAVDLAHPV